MVQFLRNCFWFIIGFCLLTMHTSFGAGGESKAGIGIFDTLYIAGNGILAVHGDIHLTKAHVLGEGRLVMKTDKDAKILADQSEINNLEVITYGKVTLKGELAIHQSLTVQSGVLDISAATLILSDTAAIQLQQGAQLLQYYKVTGLPIRGTHQYTAAFSAKAILTSTEAEGGRFSENTHQSYSEVHTFPLLVYTDAATIPPEQTKMMTISL